jgi:hypothetical protein
MVGGGWATPLLIRQVRIFLVDPANANAASDAPGYSG